MPDLLIHKALIALGANLGDCRGTLLQALERLDASTDVHLTRRSEWHESAPIGGPGDQPIFINAAATLETRLSPQELRLALLAVENELGRVRTAAWGPRTVDLDLLLFDAQVIESASLTLPHLRMAVRSFVLEPATQVAGDWRHPWLDATIQELWTAWKTGDEAIALLGDATFVANLAEFVSKSIPRLGQARAERLSVQGKETLVLCISPPSNADSRPRIAFAASHEAVIPGIPTLIVDLAQPEIALRDMAAAVTDAWPHLGPPGGDA